MAEKHASREAFRSWVQAFFRVELPEAAPSIEELEARLARPLPGLRRLRDAVEEARAQQLRVLGLRL